jgi:hypothetical protein
MVIRYSQPAALFEISIERHRRRGVQRNQSALPELRMANLKDAIGQYVREPQVERLGNP